MNYEKVECENCKKPYRRLRGDDWIKYCSRKCEDEVIKHKKIK